MKAQVQLWKPGVLLAWVRRKATELGPLIEQWQVLEGFLLLIRKILIIED